MASPASPQILCGAPLGSGGDTCKRKGRPCGIKSHVFYWNKDSKKKAAVMDSDPDAVDDDDESDNDSVVSADSSHHHAAPHTDSDSDSEQYGKVAVAPLSPGGAVAAAASSSSSSSSSGGMDLDRMYLHWAEARRTLQRLYAEHFSQPYTASLKKFCDVDWSLPIVLAGSHQRIERPNHGLAHSARVAYAVPLAARLLLQQQKNKKQQPNVTTRDVHCAQYMMLFAVVGRENEIGWMEASALQRRQIKQGNPNAPHLYDQFKENARRILRQHLQQGPPASLRLTKAEQDFWVSALDIGVPDLSSTLGLAMRLAHDIDLMRCYQPEEFQAKYDDEIVELLGAEGAKVLCDYMFRLIEATGDRCMGLGSNCYRAYNKPLFAKCSTNVDALLAALASVPQPLYKMPFPGDPLDDYLLNSDGEDDDDDAASQASHKSSSSMESLIGAFTSKMKLSSDSDVSKYEQLRFSHSRAITSFRSKASCPRCFYVDNDLSHDIVMEVYTTPQVFAQLNVALCQGVSDDFAKMYSLLLCKAITDSPHDASAVPSIVWRGVGYSDELLRRYEAERGRTIYLYNFTSTSRSQAVARGFATSKKHPTLIQIQVPAEARAAMADMASRSQFPHEQEILIACNAGYRIDAVDLVQRTLTLTVVDVSKCLLGQLPKRYHAECKKIVEDEMWEAGAAAKLKQKV